MKTLALLFHKDCMDGISSASIAWHTLSKTYRVSPIPVQYGNYHVEQFETYNEIFIVDFCLKLDEIEYLNSKNIKTTIIDHHITNKDVFSKTLEMENISFIFDISKSGAVLTYEYFEKLDPSVSAFSKELFLYIQDRDIWKWEMPYSKEMSESLNFLVKKNSIISFQEIMKNFDDEKQELINTGDFLLEKQRSDVEKSISHDKLKFTTLLDHDIVMLNSTTLISEIGNTLCVKYNKIAMMYFITPEMNVVLSFRSLDTLPDASILAKHFGGGGHRNACGAQLTLAQFTELFGDK